MGQTESKQCNSNYPCHFIVTIQVQVTTYLHEQHTVWVSLRTIMTQSAVWVSVHTLKLNWNLSECFFWTQSKYSKLGVGKNINIAIYRDISIFKFWISIFNWKTKYRDILLYWYFCPPLIDIHFVSWCNCSNSSMNMFVSTAVLSRWR